MATEKDKVKAENNTNNNFHAGAGTLSVPAPSNWLVPNQSAKLAEQSPFRVNTYNKFAFPFTFCEIRKDFRGRIILACP